MQSVRFSSIFCLAAHGLIARPTYLTPPFAGLISFSLSTCDDVPVVFFFSENRMDDRSAVVVWQTHSSIQRTVRRRLHGKLLSGSFVAAVPRQRRRRRARREARNLAADVRRLARATRSTVSAIGFSRSAEIDSSRSYRQPVRSCATLVPFQARRSTTLVLALVIHTGPVKPATFQRKYRGRPSARNG